VRDAEQVGAGAWSHLFGSPDFWRLWFIGFVLYVVRWIEMIAMAVFVYQQTGSALLVAMLTVLRMLPLALVGSFAGALADRVERRSVLAVVVALMMATSLALALLAWVDALEVWHLILASFVNGLGWAADNPVRRLMIGDVVGAERMGKAMSIEAGTNNASRVFGPTIGGVLLAKTGIEGAFVLSVLLYAGSFAAAIGIAYRNSPVAAGGASVLKRIAEGLMLARSERRLTGTLVVTAIFNIFGWPFTSMIPVIGKDALGLGPEGVGMLASMEGLGALLGALAIGLLARPRHYGRIYVGGILIYLTMLAAFAVVPGVLLAGSALVLTGIGGAGFSVMQATLIYLAAPPDMRGRLLGVLSVCIGLGPIGFLHIGLMAEAIGSSAATALVGLEGLLAMAATWRLWRGLVREAG
jgi:MFS family permease